MNLLENWKNVIVKFKSYDYETLEAMKTGIIFAIIINLFGIYWYFDLKALGGALLVFFIVSLVIILLLERGIPYSKTTKLKKKTIHNINKMEDKKMEETGTTNQEIEEDQEESSNQFGFNMDSGFPSSEGISKGLSEFSGLGSF